MGKYYLAVDIGASSGRHILGHLENGKIELEEIYVSRTAWIIRTESFCGMWTGCSVKS